MSFSGSPSVQTLLPEIICHGFDVWHDHVHCHSIVRCWGWGTISTATAANESWLLEVFNRVISFSTNMHFSPTKKTEFVSDWLFQVSLLVVRNWVRPTFRDPETFMKTTVLYILKDRNDARWSLTDHCMYLMSFFGILWLVLILFTQMVTEPRSQGPPLHGGRVGEDPGNETDSYHLAYWPASAWLLRSFRSSAGPPGGKSWGYWTFAL